MGVNLSIKGVPEALADRLRSRAARNQRSLQRELMVIIEAAAQASTSSRAVAVADSPAPVYELAAAPRRATKKGQAAEALAASDDLLAKLDAIVAGTHWGSAPALTREQAHDRRLQREFDYDARQAESAR